MLDKTLRVAIEASCLKEPDSGCASFARELIRGLLETDKKTRFSLQYSEMPLFSPEAFRGKQHNLRSHRYFDLTRTTYDIYHWTGNCIPRPIQYERLVATPGDLASISGPYLEIMKKADRIVLPWESMLGPALSTFGGEGSRISVVNPGIDPSFSKRPKAETDLIKTRYAIKRPYILVPGPVSDRSNLHKIIEAYSKLIYLSPPDMVVTGKIREGHEYLRSHIRELELESHIKLLGRLPKKVMPALYSGAEIVVSAGTSFGFCMSLLEAMACGSPLVVSRSIHTKEVCSDAAAYAESNSADSIADTIKDVLTKDSRRTALSAAGSTRARSFSSRASAKATMEVYRKAMK